MTLNKSTKTAEAAIKQFCDVLEQAHQCSAEYAESSAKTLAELRRTYGQPLVPAKPHRSLSLVAR